MAKKWKQEKENQMEERSLLSAITQTTGDKVREGVPIMLICDGLPVEECLAGVQTLE